MPIYLYLFIGGAADGKRLAVHEPDVFGQPTIVVPRVYNNYALPPEAIRDTYHRIGFRFEQGLIVVYVIQGMSQHQAFARLVEHYRPPADQGHHSSSIEQRRREV